MGVFTFILVLVEINPILLHLQKHSYWFCRTLELRSAPGGGGGKGLVDCFSVGVITQSSKRWSNIDLHRPSMCPKQFSCLY